jgi:hypothetical protein
MQTAVMESHEIVGTQGSSILDPAHQCAQDIECRLRPGNRHRTREI